MNLNFELKLWVLLFYVNNMNIYILMICLNLDNIFNWIKLNVYYNLVKSKVVKGNLNVEFKFWIFYILCK